MPDKEPKHNLSYRQDILVDFSNYIQSGDSFFLIGAASMGKTRLIDFVMRSDVQKHYFGAEAVGTWLIRVDLNRLCGTEDWNFYELLLSAMMLNCNQYENADLDKIQAKLVDLDSKVIESHDFLRALRFFELAVNMLCQSYKINMCFLFDEFDEQYKTMNHKLFSQLRAVRDANKNRVCYGLFLRNLPEKLRTYNDVESFRELFGSRMIGLKPYSLQDTLQVIQQLESRKQVPIPIERREWIFTASGGHPGLIVALVDVFIANPQAANKMADYGWFVEQKSIADECKKLWNGLLDEERSGLLALARGSFGNVPMSTRALLNVKGLIRNQNERAAFFSPLLEKFIISQLP
jgi:hypothetical protein